MMVSLREMSNSKVQISLGLAAGNVYQSKSNEIEEIFQRRNWLFWSPEYIKEKVCALAAKGYENEPAIITAKILMR